MGLSQLLVINPNTSASVSALLHTHVEAALAACRRRCGCTPPRRFGAPYIADEASYQVAGHAALDAWAAALAGPMPAPDAVLIGCFGDPGLWALRESSPAPVIGLAEAAFIEAAAHGRFAVVTGGERWAPMLQRLALQLGRAEALAGIVTVAPSGADMAADPAAAQRVLAQACQQALARWPDVRALVLGGAGLAGMAAALQPGLPLPLIDSVAPARACWRPRPWPAGARRRPGLAQRWSRVSPELLALGPAAPPP
jgi:Asp/Glu/hydantoin racemase